MGDVVLLRKLSEKSILGFGKYAEYSVSSLLESKKSMYLAWVYFNMSGISFTDELIEKIIPTRFRIEKPGISPEKHKEYVDAKMKFFIRENNTGYVKQRAHNKKAVRCSAINKKIIDDYRYNKALLQSKNHGHK